MYKHPFFNVEHETNTVLVYYLAVVTSNVQGLNIQDNRINVVTLFQINVQC